MGYGVMGTAWHQVGLEAGGKGLDVQEVGRWGLVWDGR